MHRLRELLAMIFPHWHPSEEQERELLRVQEQERRLGELKDDRQRRRDTLQMQYDVARRHRA